ncbi:LOW QUALITY PROTEIN: olfactory receptor 1D2-like [Camelus ferus]|uniref:Olfactory receptor n=2 Tax=Camelus TaxID=9836 RepID=A0A8B7KGG2_CAMFR|nr:LOW QUALITY PROTEIN: olfactory receptor 1D2-like [Camelus ferus]XP_045361314.1 LOW QUALITY PROTEIN: olfactory receptor 1D2-like [Camelus bactrianus]
MVKGNLSVTPEFLLLGLSEVPEHQPFLFCLFLTMYLVAVVGNLLIVLAISATSTLHIPMYFLIASLSCVDVCFTSVTVPKMLLNMHAQSQSISYGRCLAQMYFLILFLELDNVLLALMAYDRFLAICHPLHYTTTMSPKFCIMSVSVALIVTNVYPLVHTLLMSTLSFCASVRIHHIFCELYALLKLSCSDTHTSELVVYTMGSFLFVCPFLFLSLSYVRIFSAIQRLRSSRGKLKAFSTCSSHLAVVSLFYGTLFGVYLRPSSSYTAEDSAATVLAIYPNPDCPVQFYCEWNETQVTRHVLCRAPLSGGVCNYSVSQTFCDGDAAIVRVF